LSENQKLKHKINAKEADMSLYPNNKIEAWLVKRGKVLLNTRWCILNDGIFSYHKQKGKKPKGMLLVRQMPIEVGPAISPKYKVPF
jgi:hypothetical protein